MTSATDRRPLTYAVLLCLAGAALALFAATRIWAVEVTARPAPLPALREVRTGGDLLPWLPALALVGLAGAGAVLATRGVPRRVVGGLLLAVGAGVTAGAGYAALAPAAGAAGSTWPLLCAVGGLALTLGGTLTAARGNRWPAMGARYERAAAKPGVAGWGGGPGAAADDPRAVGRGLVETWDALDRGEDPTASAEDPTALAEKPSARDGNPAGAPTAREDDPDRPGGATGGAGEAGRPGR